MYVNQGVRLDHKAWMIIVFLPATNEACRKVNEAHARGDKTHMDAVANAALLEIDRNTIMMTGGFND